MAQNGLWKGTICRNIRGILHQTRAYRQANGSAESEAKVGIFKHLVFSTYSCVCQDENQLDMHKAASKCDKAELMRTCAIYLY